MKIIITEEMKYRHRVVLYAIKHNNNAEAARRYGTSRQQVQRWRKKYDGNIRSLTNKSRRPHSHPNQHNIEEVKLIREKYRKHRHEGLAQVYRKCKESGYKRSYGSMCKQIRRLDNYTKVDKIKYPRSKYNKLNPTYPGEYVQMDTKFVPIACIGFKSEYSRYYQITAIDLFSRKRVIKLVKEHSTYETAKVLWELEKEFGFKISTIQTDNGTEFCNNIGQKESLFERVARHKGIKLIRTRPYSPWQNGIVERSHKIDNELFYSRRRFKNEKEMYKAFKRYSVRTNNIARKVLGFKTPNEIVKEYFKNIA